MRPFIFPVLAVLALLTATSLASAAPGPSDPQTADIIVYGGTASGVTAGVQAARMGRSVIVLEPGGFIGGMVTGGLGATDNGANETVSGIAIELYHAAWDRYLDSASWKHETRDEWLPKHGLAVTRSMKAHWFLEPHVATELLQLMLDRAKVRVLTNARLDRSPGGVTKTGSRITEIRTEDGRRFAGKIFIDSTYEGDLMAAAGVSYAVGREANSVYGETVNGIHVFDANRAKHIDPFIRPGDPSSGLLPRIESKTPGKEGDGDHRVQAYNFRLCLTDVIANQVPIAKPAAYDALQYEGVLRNMTNRRSWKPGKLPFTLTPMPNRKTDTNNAGMFSTDFVGGGSDAWPEASYAEREKIFEAHKTYTLGMLWFLANDERVPSEIRASMSKWGLAKDEFTETGNWPHQLYVREARRMVGSYVMTEADCLHTRQADDPVALGSYAIDSHHVSYFADENGVLRIDGGLYQGVKPYAISYRAILPKREQCDNLLVSVACSASHAAYGSIRMEPVFMMLGQAAATAASLSVAEQRGLHDLPYGTLRKQLLTGGLVLVDTRADKRKPPKARVE
jgi:hypothetical protein